MDFEFSAEMWQWRGPAPFHFITLPEEATAPIKAISGLVTYGWGMIPVRARIGQTEWTTAMFPREGRYVLPVKDIVRTAEGLLDGDIAAVHVSIRE
ncbi:MAG TPA: DUF1905 domain-containing protein [Candidatus Limnocylindrales bacterium]